MLPSEGNAMMQWHEITGIGWTLIKLITKLSLNLISLGLGVDAIVYALC